MLRIPDNLVLYGRYASPFVRRVAVTLRLYGIEYRHIPLMPFGPGKVELARFNPIAHARTGDADGPACLSGDDA
jgi:glutathione S-transferase